MRKPESTAGRPQPQEDLQELYELIGAHYSNEVERYRHASFLGRWLTEKLCYLIPETAAFFDGGEEPSAPEPPLTASVIEGRLATS